jgi:peptidoglycan/LPS O-acetylase OafA/YrhL
MTLLEPQRPRLDWIDIMKGISILWIAFFHFFSAYDTGRYPWPLNFSSFPSFLAACNPSSHMDTLGNIVDGMLAALFQRGPQAVGVFLALSGFSLTYAVMKSGIMHGTWLQWYRRRLLRLFPLYWAAHVLYLVSPWVHRKDAVDFRFILSMLGDRVWPVDAMFYYLNPSWWFFGLLLQLYIVFPLFFRLVQRVGIVRYLLICGLITIISRYMLFGVIHAHGNFIQGAFFGSRLWEFAAGMAFALLYHKSPERAAAYLFSWQALLLGIILYALGEYSYRPGLSYTVTDALLGTGLFIIVAHAAGIAAKIFILKWLLTITGIYSYGIYLLHHPYVMYWGSYAQGCAMAAFIPYACFVVAVICCGAIFVERVVTKLCNRSILFIRSF